MPASTASPHSNPATTTTTTAATTTIEPTSPSQPPPLPHAHSTPKRRTKLALCADVCAFCPSPSARRVLAAGAYELDEAAGVREGLIYLFDTSDDGLEEICAPLPCAGVFELLWGPGDGDGEGAASRLLLHAGADGSVNVFQLLEPLREGLQSLASAPPDPRRGFCLSAAWLHDGEASSSSRVASSYRSGCVATFAFAESALVLEHEIADAHALFGAPSEVWAVAQGPGAHQTWTGADDSLLKLWDLRSHGGSGRPALVAKDHGAGVCVIRPRPGDPHLLATGSYDERVRIYDVRALERGPLNATAAADPTGGGCWRISWAPGGRALAAACMQGGCRVYELGSDGAALTEVDSYDGHGSITYGIDWRRDGSGALASCSFYDKELHSWSASCTHLLKCAREE